MSDEINSAAKKQEILGGNVRQFIPRTQQDVAGTNQGMKDTKDFQTARVSSDDNDDPGPSAA